jgi:hypothetical protein
MINLRDILGGPELTACGFATAIRRTVDVLERGVQGNFGHVDVIFHIPGSILNVDWVGPRVAMFRRKHNTVVVQVGVPPEVVCGSEDEINRFVFAALRESVRLCAPKFAKAEIPCPIDEYLGRTDAAEARVPTWVDPRKKSGW